MIRFEGVTKSYDPARRAALAHVNVEIEKGEFVFLVGASGSGKSTLLHLIGAIDRPEKGTITVGQQQITTLNQRQLADYRAGIGFVFQQFHLLPDLTVTDNVLAPLVERKTSYDRHQRAAELIEAVGLKGRETAVPSQLSGVSSNAWRSPAFRSPTQPWSWPRTHRKPRLPHQRRDP